jgi:hypothetical protein
MANASFQSNQRDQNTSLILAASVSRGFVRQLLAQKPVFSEQRTPGGTGVVRNLSNSIDRSKTVMARPTSAEDGRRGMTAGIVHATKA